MQILDQARDRTARPDLDSNGVKGGPAATEWATNPRCPADETKDGADRDGAPAPPKRDWIAACLCWLLNCAIEGFAAYAQSAYPGTWRETAALNISTRDRRARDERTLVNQVAPARTRPRRSRLRRRMIGELAMLDDRLLKDIGVHKHHVEISSKEETLWL